MSARAIGRVIRAGDVLFREGDIGDCMYVIQEGEAEVIRTEDGKDTRVAVMGAGDLFGEMAIIRHEKRSATVRALTDLTVLTIDKRTFLRRVQEDPSLAFTVLHLMSRRVYELDSELAELKRSMEAKKEQARL
ncbi:MAG TPA: cyclic nucleotide-binding domain-containing protein [Rhodothermia bacterium]|nr:cyclic nucleotide-binding domain-containing protein [Rhodothermia bacterium]